MSLMPMHVNKPFIAYSKILLSDDTANLTSSFTMANTFLANLASGQFFNGNSSFPLFTGLCIESSVPLETQYLLSFQISFFCRMLCIDDKVTSCPLCHFLIFIFLNYHPTPFFQDRNVVSEVSFIN